MIPILLPKRLAGICSELVVTDFYCDFVVMLAIAIFAEMVAA